MGFLVLANFLVDFLFCSSSYARVFLRSFSSHRISRFGLWRGTELEFLSVGLTDSPAWSLNILLKDVKRKTDPNPAADSDTSMHAG